MSTDPNQRNDQASGGRKPAVEGAERKRETSHRDVVRHIDELRAQLRERYGEMPDSADLIREDRER
jgi:hypothetical protein